MYNNLLLPLSLIAHVGDIFGVVRIFFLLKMLLLRGVDSGFRVRVCTFKIV